MQTIISMKKSFSKTSLKCWYFNGVLNDIEIVHGENIVKNENFRPRHRFVVEQDRRPCFNPDHLETA